MAAHRSVRDVQAPRMLLAASVCDTNGTELQRKLPVQSAPLGGAGSHSKFEDGPRNMQCSCRSPILLSRSVSPFRPASLLEDGLLTTVKAELSERIQTGTEWKTEVE
eukprot:2702256-Amphidinium_carterae.1